MPPIPDLASRLWYQQLRMHEQGHSCQTCGHSRRWRGRRVVCFAYPSTPRVLSGRSDVPCSYYSNTRLPANMEPQEEG